MRELRRRVEIGLLTESAIRGRPVKGPSLADHILPDADRGAGANASVNAAWEARRRHVAHSMWLTDIQRRCFR